MDLEAPSVGLKVAPSDPAFQGQWNHWMKVVAHVVGLDVDLDWSKIEVDVVDYHEYHQVGLDH